MDRAIEASAASYDESLAVGQRYIRENWNRLCADTRGWFVAEGNYGASGAAPGQDDERSDIVERLEYALGTLKRCVAAKLPQRVERGAVVPAEALTDDVLSACGDVLHHPCRGESVFLRTALRALRQHEMACLLCRLPARSRGTTGLLGGAGQMLFGLFGLLLVLASPAMLSAAMVSAVRGDATSTTAALYGLGLTAWAVWASKKPGQDTDASKNERAYSAWLRLGVSLHDDWVANGAAASCYLEDMLRKGLGFPLIALDLCAALQASTLGRKEDV